MKSFGQYLVAEALDPQNPTATFQEPHFVDAHPRLANFLGHLASHTYKTDEWWKKHGDRYHKKYGTKRQVQEDATEIPTAKPGSPGTKVKTPRVSTAAPLDKIKSQGLESINKAKATDGKNPFARMREGFHAAFPENEHPDVTKQKALEAQKHFRQFMTERGGHSGKNTAELTSQNGKTRLSSGEGVNTIGIAMAPHKTSGYEHDLCPKATAECRKNCLGLTAGGNRQYPEAALRAKILRTQYVHEHPEHAARLLSHEIGANEKWAKTAQAYHVGDQKFHDKKEAMEHAKKTGGKITGTSPSPMKSGVRLNVTSDIPYEKLLPKQFFDRHKDSQFYDYTKVHGRMGKDLPSNYALALSHTGTGHAESNDREAIHHLNNGGVVAMVYHRGKDVPTPTHVEDVSTGKRWKVANGDDDDNVYDRHKTAGIDKSEGVVSGLRLKGVTNDAAGKFANRVDPDGVIRINRPGAPQKNPFNVLK